MNLQDTKETILKWIFSCEKEDQVDLLTEVVTEFVSIRFRHEGKFCELATEELIRALVDQKILIKRIAFQSLPDKTA